MSLVEGRDLELPGRLERTDLSLAAGTVTCLIGPNGSGKTSMLHALAGVSGARGAVTIGGQDISALTPAERPRALTYLSASRELRWPLSARDLIALGGADAAEVAAELQRSDLDAFAERPLDRLSTGERSRVLIARAMATRPQLLLLDEPTANLDPLWQIRLMERVRAEVSGGARAALVAMHDLDAAGRYADRLIVMSGGRIAADGEPSAVLAGPVIPEVFGVERLEGKWVSASSLARDERSSCEAISARPRSSR